MGFPIMKTALILAGLAVCSLVACSTGTEGDRLTVQDKICIRSLERVAQYLHGDGEPGGVRSTALAFKEIAATWTPGDPPLDVRLWVDDARLVHRVQNNCHSPESSVLVNLGGRLRLVDITLRPVPNPRPARKGRVVIIDLPPAGDDEDEEEE